MADLATATQPTVQAIYATWEKRGNRQKGHRRHLGASLMGEECLRSLWYTFRWSTDLEHDGRLLRLFDRGQLEESRFVRELQNSGVTVYEIDPQSGKQYLFSECQGHVGGSMDGVGKGFLESPDKWHVLEFKTHSDKSFKELVSKGVKESKPTHYAQMQLYMGWTRQHPPGIDRAFYLSVNKDNDELYSERIRFDEKTFDTLMRKAWDIVKSPIPLEKMSQDGTFYKCKMCNHADVCQGNTLPAVNCRTCVHSTPELDGKGSWSCARCNIILTDQQQRSGCEEHLFIPQLVTWASQVDASEEDNWIEFEYEGTRFKNGAKGPNSYPSPELRQVVPDLLSDSFVEGLREEFGAFYADNLAEGKNNDL
jgi:hypothetical protein